MPLKFGKNRVDLIDDVAVDDAETLFGWLTAHPRADVRTGQARNLHAAVLQALAASRCRISGTSPDPFLAECIRQISFRD